MELILINDSKLKIMLSPSDMKEYDISCDRVDYRQTETRRAFWCILDEAKHRTGFDAASEKVYIQMYPSKEGGCEMYVTKLGFTSPSEDTVDLAKASISELAFCFSELKPLLMVCRQLDHIGLSDAGDVYRNDKGYYLFLDTSAAHPDSFAFISEFGDKEDPGHLRAYVSEYASLLCERAARKLGSLI